MKGLKKDKIPKKTAKKIMVALACIMATSLPFSQSVYAADAYGTEASGTKHETSNGTSTGDPAEDLVLEIDSGDSDDKAYGGSAEGADATGNTVTVSDNGTAQRIEGGHAATDSSGNTGHAENNTVTIVEGATGAIGTGVGNVAIIGGYAKDYNGGGTSGDATGNTVDIKGGAITGGVEGGRSIGGVAVRNTVEVTNGDIDANGNVAIMGGNSTHGASDNTVTIHSTGGTNNIKGDVMGAQSSPASGGATVDRNAVTVENGTIVGSIFGAFATPGATATGNRVNIAGGTIDASTGSLAGVTGIYGAYADGDVTQNVVDISDGTITGNAIIVGGQSGSANARNNQVNISDGTVAGKVYGGNSGLAVTGEATGNTVTITGGTITATAGDNAVMGGFGAGLAQGNAVTIENAVVNGANIVGGSSETLSKGNRVTIKSGANVAKSVYGAGSNANAEDNVVTMEGGDVGENIVGAMSFGGSVSNNQVTMAGGTAKSAVGGYTDGGDDNSASGNTLTIKGNASLTGTSIMQGAAAGVATVGTADGNNLFIQDDANIAGYAAAGVASVLGGSGQATNNTLTMTGGTVNSNVQGGYSIGGDATGNRVVMSGGTAGNNVYGGYALNNALNSGNAADNNTVEISGGTVANHVMGGNGWSGANDNTVTLKGGTFGHGVYGGRIEGADTSLLRNNRVFISGASEFTDTNATITAALAKSASETDRYVNTSGTGNNVYLGYVDENTTAPLTKAINVDTIAGENLYLGAFGGEAVTAGESGAAVTAVNVKAGNIDLSKVAVDRIVSEDFTILEATDGLDPSTTVTDGTVTMGTTVQQEAGKVGANKIGFKPGTRTVQTQTSHALLNAQAGVAALAAGNTLIERAAAGLDMDSQAVENPREWRSFAYVGGGKAKYDTGSSVITNTWNGMLGFGRHDQRKDGGALTYDIFYEYGNGNYSTDDSDGRGDGDARYNGGGLLAKNETANGFYYEGSFRAGRMKNDANNILRVGNRTYGYSEDSNYWGFHLGVGKVLKFNNDRSLDVYGKYFYNHLDGINFDAAGHYDLDDVKTSLLRLGARYNFLKRSGWTSYGGFAYEYEFGGEAGGFADGFAIRKADLGGSSVLFELGMKLLPDDKSPWGLDLNLTAHAGQRKGVMGGATVSYAF